MLFDELEDTSGKSSAWMMDTLCFWANLCDVVRGIAVYS